MSQQTGKYLIAGGLVLVAIGMVIYFFGNKLHWFGRLPGDIKIENTTTKFYFPLVSMLLVSLLLTLVINIFKRW